MKYLFLVVACVVSFATFAQRPQGSSYGGMMPKGSLTGNVIDATSQEPIPYATVTIKREKDSTTVTGDLTQEDGTFKINDVTPGKHIVEISFIGYDRKVFGPYLFSPKETMNHTIKDATLGVNANELDAVVVEGIKDAVTYEVDKKVYDASKIKSAEGGTARDVLEQIPSITVNSDQSLELRGSGNVRVLLNGRPSTMDLNTILEQIPQKQIKDIEIITNPSAKYDAEGEVGIINIILKTNDLEGFTGGVNANYGTVNKYTGGVNFAYKVGKWNLSTNLNHRHFEDDFERTYNRTLDATPDQNQFSSTDTDFIRRNTSAKLGVDYYLDDNNTIFVSGGYRHSKDNDDITGINQNVFSNLFNGTSNIPSAFYTYDRNGVGSEDGEGYSVSAAFQHNFNGNPKHNLLIDSQYETRDQVEPANYTINSLTNTQTNEVITGFTDFNQELDDRTNLTISADYTNPISKKVKVEAGAKLTKDTRDRDFTLKYNDVLNSFGSGVFDLDQTITAGYVTYQNQISETVGLKGGLRAEHTDISSIASGGQQSTYEDNYVSLFPSASASYKVDDNLQLTGSYSRRVFRPRGRQLNPFANRSDINNVFVGNSSLKPQFTDSYELGFNKYFGEDVGLDGAFYFRNLKDQIQYVSTYDAVANINRVTFYNLTRQKSYGIESSVNIKPSKLKWYSARISGNYNYQKAVENNSQFNLNSQDFKMFSGRINNNFNLPKSIRAGVGFNYTSPRNNYTGDMKSMWSLNANASKQIMNNKGTLFIRSNDIFNTQGLRGSLVGEGRSQTIDLDWPSQMTFFGFNYNFGNLKRGATRRKMKRQEDRGGQSPDAGMGM